MTRSVQEWIGKTDDSVMPARVRLRVFLKYEGVCQCGCGIKIVTGMPWQADHKTAIINGGENRESNLVPLLVEHHKHKTKEDVEIKSRTYESKKRQFGLKKPKKPIPGSRSSPWKRKMDGTIERRK